MEKGTIYWPNYGELATEPPGISHDDGSRAGAVSLAFMPGPLSLHTATMLMPLAPEFKGFTSFARPLSYLAILPDSKLLSQAIPRALSLGPPQS